MLGRILWGIACLWICGAPSANATVTYVYRGNPFTEVIAPYTTTDSVYGSITLGSPLAPNLNFVDISHQILSLSFTDGNQILDLSSSYSVLISTDAAGNLVAPWMVNILPMPDPGSDLITTRARPGAVVLDQGDLNPSSFGTVSGNPGTWSMVVPEPSTFSLCMWGGFLVAAAARRRRSVEGELALRSAQPTCG